MSSDWFVLIRDFSSCAGLYGYYVPVLFEKLLGERTFNFERLHDFYEIKWPHYITSINSIITFNENGAIKLNSKSSSLAKKYFKIENNDYTFYDILPENIKEILIEESIDIKNKNKYTPQLLF